MAVNVYIHQSGSTFDPLDAGWVRVQLDGLKSLNFVICCVGNHFRMNVDPILDLQCSFQLC